MERRLLGTTGIEVSRFAIGAGNFGGIGSAPAFFDKGVPKEDAFRILDEGVELGMTLIDTADAYGGGRSEAWIGEWLVARGPAVREAVVLSTKVFHSVEGDPADHGLAPDRIRGQIEGSLRRLGVDEIDLYLAHEPDPDVPLVETLAAFDALVTEGKIRAYGLSNYDAAGIREALDAADAEGLRRPGWVQNNYSLLERGAETDAIPVCLAEGLGFTPFSPLAGGWLTGKYRRGEEVPAGSRMTERPEPYLHLRKERVFDALEELERRAAAHGVSMAGLALAWLLGAAGVTAVVTGPRRPGQLAPAAEAAALALDPAEHAEIAALFA